MRNLKILLKITKRLMKFTCSLKINTSLKNNQMITRLVKNKKLENNFKNINIKN